MSNKAFTGRAGASPGGMYGNRFNGTTERDLGNAMGMVAGGPGRLPPEGVQSMASRFISETGGNFTDMGIQRAADARMLAAGNIYADPVATASVAPTAAQAAVTEALAFAPQRPRMKMTIPGLMASNAGSMAGGGRSGNSGEGQSRGSAWGAGGSRPTGGGAGGERTGARSFYGR